MSGSASAPHAGGSTSSLGSRRAIAEPLIFWVTFLGSGLLVWRTTAVRQFYGSFNVTPAQIGYDATDLTFMVVLVPWLGYAVLFVAAAMAAAWCARLFSFLAKWWWRLLLMYLFFGVAGGFFVVLTRSVSSELLGALNAAGLGWLLGSWVAGAAVLFRWPPLWPTIRRLIRHRSTFVAALGVAVVVIFGTGVTAREAGAFLQYGLSGDQGAGPNGASRQLFDNPSAVAGLLAVNIAVEREAWRPITLAAFEEDVLGACRTPAEWAYLGRADGQIVALQYPRNDSRSGFAGAKVWTLPESLYVVGIREDREPTTQCGASVKQSA